MQRHMILPTCLLGLALCAGLAADQLMPQAVAQRSEIKLDRYEGFTEPSRSLVVESYLDGVLKKLHVKSGDTFKQGSPLASLDEGMQVVAVEVARLRAESQAEAKIAEARVTEAEVELESQEALAKNGSATARDVRRAKAAVEVAKAQLELAKENQKLAAKQLEIERERLELYTIRAPFDGKVLSIATQEGTEEGAALRQNDRIMHIAQLDPVIAKISLPQSVINSLRIGERYPLQVGVDSDTVPARLKRIASQADRGSQLIEVVFEIANPNDTLRSGLRCKLVDVSPVKAKASQQ